MNVLIFLSCSLALASAGYLGHHGIHIPVIGPHGVPLDTPEVQHARAAHLAALSEASSRSGYGGGYDQGNNYDDGSYRGEGEQYTSGPSHYASHAVPHAYATSHVLPAVTHDGVPLNTPEVNAAAAHHFAAHHEALGRIGPQHYRHRRSIYGGYGGGYHGPQHIPVIGHNGVPVDTPEVQHARAAHLAALSAAGGHGHAVYGHGAPIVAYGGHGAWAHHGVPAIAHDGTPLDTAEVAHAKAAHFAAFHEAAARNGVHSGYATGGWGGHYNGAPADTPEVQHAKAAHFAAHAAARGHHY